MPPIDSLLVSLAPRDHAEFLPEPVLTQCRLLAARWHVRESTADAELGAFHRELAALNPEVLIAGWSTPALPADLPSRLRYLCNLTGSVKRIVRREHVERGLVVSNWGRSISRTVAECALMLMLAALRRAGFWIPAMHRDRAWKTRQTETASLFGRRVGVHGFGHVARELVRLLQPFDVAIEVCAPEDDPALYRAHGVTRAASLEALFADNEVVVEAAPLLPETTGIVTERLLRLMRPGGVFVNVARGAIVEEDALVRVAREGQIQFALDVFAVEPLPVDSPLRGLPNVILLPHIAGPTTDRRRDAGEFALRNLRAYAAGEPLEAVISSADFDRVA
jgi:phosphoglycerate dehydrogenase-like enzyme